MRLAAHTTREEHRVLEQWAFKNLVFADAMLARVGDRTITQNNALPMREAAGAVQVGLLLRCGGHRESLAGSQQYLEFHLAQRQVTTQVKEKRG